MKDLLLYLTSPTLFIIGWELYYIAIIRNPFVLAPPSKVFYTFFILLIGRDPLFFMPLDILYSFYHYLIGLSLAIATGFTVGVLAGYYENLRKSISLLIEAIRPIPPIAWIPIAILLLKLTHEAAGFIIFLGAFFPILTNTMSGVMAVERKYIEAAMTLGALKPSQLIFKVVIPASLPSFLIGIKVGSGVAWMCVIAAELFGVSSYGLGYKIELARMYHSPDIVIAYMLMIGIIGLILDRVVMNNLERALLKWRRGVVIG
ncbi:MAG: ABC transporter permease [Candidatus Korarchaeum sp.]